MINLKKIIFGCWLSALFMGSASVECSEILKPDDLRRERIYSVITSRFYDGDEENNFYNRERIEKGDPHYRGDFKGLAEKLEYIKNLGFTAVCITPPVENRGGLDFMGFNTYDPERFEPRLTSKDFSYGDLIKKAHELGLKIIQTIVVNHCSNYGIRNYYFIPRLPLKFYKGSIKPEWPYIFNLGNYKDPFRMDNDNPLAPEWFKDWRFRDPWAAGPLHDPVTGKTFPGDNLHPERFFDTDEDSLDPDFFHRDGWLGNGEFLDIDRVQKAHLDQNSIDLATENWKVKDFYKKIVKRYISLGVNGFRIQFARNTPRQDLIHMVEVWKDMKPDLMVFADVASELDGFGSLNNSDEPSELCPWWYTRKTSNPNEPEIAGNSDISVMDYALFRDFSESLANGHFGGIGELLKWDWVYAEPSSLITFFHNYDLGPEVGNLTRFSGETWKAACAYNLLWTMRGVPMLMMGEEIEFQKGFPQKYVLPTDKLSGTGKAYFGDNLTEENAQTTQSHPLFQHIKRLNAIREAVPALSLGDLEQGNEFVSGISFIRNYNNGESYAVIGLSAFIDQDMTVSRVLPGTYRDAITGQEQIVATSTREISFNVKGNSAGIWVFEGPGKIGEDGEFLR